MTWRPASAGRWSPREGARLLTFLAGDSDIHDIQFTPPDYPSRPKARQAGIQTGDAQATETAACFWRYNQQAITPNTRLAVDGCWDLIVE